MTLVTCSHAYFEQEVQVMRVGYIRFGKEGPGKDCVDIEYIVLTDLPYWCKRVKTLCGTPRQTLTFRLSLEISGSHIHSQC